MSKSLAAGSAVPHFRDYSRRLAGTLEAFDWAPVERLADELLACWGTGRQVFLVGRVATFDDDAHDLVLQFARQNPADFHVVRAVGHSRLVGDHDVLGADAAHNANVRSG